MDTKWKNNKKTISFLIFFLGISLTLGSVIDIYRNKPSGVQIWQTDKLLEEDYQLSRRFREYMANRLENFLIMATGGDGLDGIWGYGNGTYYGGGYYGDYYYGDFGNVYSEAYLYDYYNDQSPSTEAAEETVQEEPGLPVDTESISALSLRELESYLDGLGEIGGSYLEILNTFRDIRQLSADDIEACQELLEDYQDELENYLDALKDYTPNLNTDIKPLTKEQKEKIARKYHDRIKGDKNLLYTIAYDGEVLYSNSDALPADGKLTAPDGYNFILYFDGEKVRILKDGKELNVYGDGYYREDSDWYVPGYSNFQTDEAVNKAAVCIAAAKDPILYLEGTYGNGESMQYDNSLYWMSCNLRARRDLLNACFARLAVGVLLLVLAFLFRKSRREAVDRLARFQAKIWTEFKFLLLAAVFVFYWSSIQAIVKSNWLWEEILYSYTFENSLEENITTILTLVTNIPPLLWLILFWSVYLLWNDTRHNKKIWKHSLIDKLCVLYSTKNMNQAVSRKAVLRNRLAFIASILYGALMTGCIVMVYTVGRDRRRIFAVIALAALFGTIGLLLLLWRLGMKNVEMARDVEALSHRVDEIRRGNYKVFDNPMGTGGSGGKRNSVTLEGENNSPGNGGNSSDNGGNFPDNGSDFRGHDLENILAQLEDISHGMANAVDEQMKSERMKVELIANVSHDIKTPLTSIISYVEFLKQEEELPEHVKDYVRILDEKSQRLKNMVQDVFAVSKAASGELPVQMEALDFGKLLRQTMADMEEQIAHSSVTFRTQIPDTPVMILADGERMYRVFQNLFQNAIKYSLDGSRVYVTLKTDGALAAASVKNTSQMELDKDKDFVERFARGDASRTDGGSGLGLSIAQSFTEACGGEFMWETDADLFVVKISFHTL